MKKVLFFVVMFFVLAGITFAGIKSSDGSIIVGGFDGLKPLTKNQTVSVSFPERPEDWYLIDAFKGENRISFLKRINTDTVKLETKYTPIYYSQSKNSLATNKNVVKDKNSRSISTISDSPKNVWYYVILVVIICFMVAIILFKRLGGRFLY